MKKSCWGLGETPCKLDLDTDSVTDRVYVQISEMIETTGQAGAGLAVSILMDELGKHLPGCRLTPIISVFVHT